MRYMSLFALSLFACGDDGGKTTPKTDAPKVVDSAPPNGDAEGIDAPTPDAPAGTTPLTVKNFASWCSVTVNGGTASAAAQQVVNVQPGTITLTAKRASSTFEVSGLMWHHTDGDNSNMGETGMITNANDAALKTSTAMVTVAATAKCVWVCCPFSSSHMGCSVGPPDNVGEQCN